MVLIEIRRKVAFDRAKTHVNEASNLTGGQFGLLFLESSVVGRREEEEEEEN